MKNMEIESYNKILKYLNKLSLYYDATICIKDFSGFISQNPDFHTAFAPFMIHDKPYCKNIKSDSDAMMYCQSQIPCIIKKSHELRCSFTGICHAGMWEIVVPIIQNNHIIGAILFGCFRTNEIDEKKNYERVKNRFNNLSLSTLKRLWDNTSPIPSETEIELIISSLEVIATSIVMLQSKKNDEKNFIEEEKIGYDHMVNNAIEYMKLHMREKITLEEIASYCNYSPSYLSHHFKKMVGENIINYMNKMKVEMSKNYLLRTNDTLVKIAEELGFSDVSYYSRTFSKICGISPANFRKKYLRMVINEGL
ncbi:MAG: AraC family transcriptional regulator [Spirochaetia bacterium]|nr:AraC family transcriptional regulator [Spirochaetia bacterium]